MVKLIQWGAVLIAEHARAGHPGERGMLIVSLDTLF